MTYTKLFSSITESTIWVEPYATRIVWVSMLAMADRRGRIWASIPGLARRSGVTLEECEAALERFQQPDKYSRTPDNEGRRISVIDGGWKLLNYDKYRAQIDEEARKEYKRDWDRTKRSRETSESDKIRQNRPPPTQAEAEAEAEAEKRFPEVRADGDSAAVRGAAALAKLKTEALTLEQAKIPGGEETPAGHLASVLLANGVKGNAFHPLVVEWAREGVTVARLQDAIARALQRKERGGFGPAYLDPILHDTTKPAAQAQIEKAQADAEKAVERTQRLLAEQRARAKAPMPEGLRPRAASS